MIIIIMIILINNNYYLLSLHNVSRHLQHWSNVRGNIFFNNIIPNSPFLHEKQNMKIIL